MRGTKKDDRTVLLDSLRVHYTDGVWLACPSRSIPEKIQPGVAWCSLHGPVRTQVVHDATLGDLPAEDDRPDAARDVAWARILSQPPLWPGLAGPSNLRVEPAAVEHARDLHARTLLVLGEDWAS